MSNVVDFGRVVGGVGPAGPAGPAGPEGPTGPQGPKGDDGPSLETVTTTGTGSAYEVESRNVNAEPANGSRLMIVPHLTSSVLEPTLSVNGGTAYPIKRRLSTDSGTLRNLTSLYVFKIGDAIEVMFDEGGRAWILVNNPQVNCTDLYGTLPVAKGGTGSTTAAGAPWIEKTKATKVFADYNELITTTDTDWQYATIIDGRSWPWCVIDRSITFRKVESGEVNHDYWGTVTLHDGTKAIPVIEFTGASGNPIGNIAAMSGYIGNRDILYTSSTNMFTDNIWNNESAGIYGCQCSGFVSAFLLNIDLLSSRFARGASEHNIFGQNAITLSKTRTTFRDNYKDANDMAYMALANGWLFEVKDITDLRPGDITFYSMPEDRETQFENISHVQVVVSVIPESNVFYTIECGVGVNPLFATSASNFAGCAMKGYNLDTEMNSNPDYFLKYAARFPINSNPTEELVGEITHSGAFTAAPYSGGFRKILALPSGITFDNFSMYKLTVDYGGKSGPCGAKVLSNPPSGVTDVAALCTNFMTERLHESTYFFTKDFTPASISINANASYSFQDVVVRIHKVNR